MLGRPPKPTALLKLEGQYRSDRHGESEPVPDGQPVMPRGLPKEAKRLWLHVVPQLTAMGIATSLDQFHLVEMVRWYATYRSWSDKAATSGKSTDLFAANSAWKAFDGIAARFGMSPADRVKLRGVVPGCEEDDEVAKFLA